MHRLLVAACLLLCAGVVHAEGDRRPPNVVLILADDLGYGDLSCFGAPDLRTPYLDGLARQGVKGTRFYANSCVCSPTRAALLSGRYPELVGVPGVIRTHAKNSWGNLTREAVLLPALLKRIGYHTALIGKWHLGLASPDTPLERGFDHFHGFLGDMMDDYFTHRRHGNNYMRRGKDTIDPKGHATTLFTDWAVDYLKHRSSTTQPFFLYLAYNAPHDPIQPPGEALKEFRKRQPKVAEKRARLAALIEDMDAGIGRVLAALRDLGLEENTLVIFTSDNGGALQFGAHNGSLRDGKGSMYEGGLRVPLIVRWPGRVPAGMTTDRIGLTMDLLPTICAAAGAKIEHAVEGKSLLPTFLGKEQPAETRDLFFIRREGGKYKGEGIHAMMRGKWALVRNLPGGPLELFDLERDPQQKREWSGTVPEVFRGMRAALEHHVQEGEKVPWRAAGRK